MENTSAAQHYHIRNGDHWFGAVLFNPELLYPYLLLRQQLHPSQEEEDKQKRAKKKLMRLIKRRNEAHWGRTLLPRRQGWGRQVQLSL